MAAGDGNPYETPTTRSRISRDRRAAIRGRKIRAGIVAGFVVSSAVLAFVWPDDWVIHMPLAALIGPWLPLRMGGEMSVLGFLSLLAFCALTLPWVFKAHSTTFGSLILAVALWVLGIFSVCHVIQVMAPRPKSPANHRIAVVAQANPFVSSPWLK